MQINNNIYTHIHICVRIDVFRFFFYLTRQERDAVEMKMQNSSMGVPMLLPMVTNCIAT
jgi:hypothetical protein